MLKAANKSNDAMVSKSLKKLAAKPKPPRFGASEAEIFAYEKAHSEWLEAKAVADEEAKKKKKQSAGVNADPASTKGVSVRRAQHKPGWNSSHHRL